MQVHVPLHLTLVLVGLIALIFGAVLASDALIGPPDEGQRVWAS